MPDLLRSKHPLLAVAPEAVPLLAVGVAQAEAHVLLLPVHRLRWEGGGGGGKWRGLVGWWVMEEEGGWWRGFVGRWVEEEGGRWKVGG